MLADEIEEIKRIIDKACELYRKDLIQVQNIITRVTHVNDVIDIQGSVDSFRQKLKKEVRDETQN